MRKKSIFPSIITILGLAIVFSIIGFTVAHYKYSGQIAKEKLEREREQQLLQALIEAQKNSLYDTDQNNEIIVTNYNDIINKETELIYKTLYTQCEHIIEKKDKPILQLIGLNKDGLEQYLTKNKLNWEIENFSKEKVILFKQENKTCPNHYLITVNKGYITIYKYDENSNKELLEETNIPINVLPIVDQEKLQRGILLESIEEVNQLLEDYSS